MIYSSVERVYELFSKKIRSFKISTMTLDLILQDDIKKLRVQINKKRILRKFSNVEFKLRKQNCIAKSIVQNTESVRFYILF